MKWETNGSVWDDVIPHNVDRMLNEVMERIKHENPVKG